MNQQGVESLIKLLRDEKDTTKAYACVCLTNMSSDELIRQDMAQNLFVTYVSAALCAKYFNLKLIKAKFLK